MENGRLLDKDSGRAREHLRYASSSDVKVRRACIHIE